MINNKLKEINEKFTYEYKYYKINIIFIIVLSVILSRCLMYAVYRFGEANGDVIRAFNIWDAEWYRSIAIDGYDLMPHGNIGGDAASWAFFPLYPMIVGGIAKATNLDTMIYSIGSILSTIFFIFALSIGYLYIVETRKNKQIGIYYILIMSFGMYSFYFSIMYTESLYLFLLSLSLYLLYKRNYILMGITGALLSATRNMGVMLVFAVAAQYTVEYLKRDNKSITEYFAEALKNPKLIFGVSLIPAGLFSYMLYLKYLVGDSLAFVHVQIAWGRINRNPIITFVKKFSQSLINHNQYNLWLCVWGGSAIIISFYLVLKKRYEEALLGIIFIFIPLCSGIQSIPRFVVGSFVFALGFLDILNGINNKLLYIAVFIISSVGELYFVFRWLEGTGGFLC